LRQLGKVIFQTAGLGYQEHPRIFVSDVLEDVRFIAPRMDEVAHTHTEGNIW
jgi:hypothetical protein